MSRIAEGLRIGFLYILPMSIMASRWVVAEPQERFEMPEFEKKSLLNGMQILFLEGLGERTPFLLMIKNGAAFDPSDKWGATYVMARMIVEKLEEEQIGQGLKRANAQIDVKVDWDAIYFFGSSPTAQLEFTLGVLADLVVRPEFDEDAFTRVRDGVLEEVKKRATRLEHRTQSLFREKLFGGNPYAHPILGTAETLKNVELRDVKVQFRRLMMPNQALMALYLDEDREELFRRLSRRWGSWVRSKAAPFTFRRASNPGKPLVILINSSDEEGSLMRWGFLGVSRSSPDYFALKILEQYLTLSLPDWAEQISFKTQIRGSANLTARRMPGYLQVTLRSPGSQLSAYYRRIMESLTSLRAGQIEPGRYEEARNLVLNEYRSSLEDPLERLYQLMWTDLYELGFNYIPTFNLRLKRVTPQVFQKVLETYFPGTNFVMVVTNPTAEFRPVVEEIGDVDVLN